MNNLAVGFSFTLLNKILYSMNKKNLILIILLNFPPNVYLAVLKII
jgi:hypothetical protein